MIKRMRKICLFMSAYSWLALPNGAAITRANAFGVLRDAGAASDDGARNATLVLGLQCIAHNDAATNDVVHSDERRLELNARATIGVGDNGGQLTGFKQRTTSRTINT